MAIRLEGMRGFLFALAGEVEGQALYSRLITSYFEAQAGVRVDTEFGDGDLRARPHLVVGLEGLAPYFFEVEPALFVSTKGDVSARFTGSYDLLLTQRLLAQPRLETNVAVQRVEDWSVGAGLNDIELGLRLRYEIRREIAPYVGVNWTTRYGEAADFARAEDEIHFKTRSGFPVSHRLNTASGNWLSVQDGSGAIPRRTRPGLAFGG